MTEDEDYADIHSCSYSCHRPGCIERQRNELAGYAQEIYKAVREAYPTHRLTFKETMEYVVLKLKEKK